MAGLPREGSRRGRTGQPNNATPYIWSAALCPEQNKAAPSFIRGSARSGQRAFFELHAFKLMQLGRAPEGVEQDSRRMFALPVSKIPAAGERTRSVLSLSNILLYYLRNSSDCTLNKRVSLFCAC